MFYAVRNKIFPKREFVIENLPDLTAKCNYIMQHLMSNQLFRNFIYMYGAIDKIRTTSTYLNNKIYFVPFTSRNSNNTIPIIVISKNHNPNGIVIRRMTNIMEQSR